MLSLEGSDTRPSPGGQRNPGSDHDDADPGRKAPPARSYTPTPEEVAAAQAAERRAAAYHAHPTEGRGSGIGSLIGAALLGGLISAGALAAYDALWRQPSDGFENRLAGVENRLGTLAPREAVTALDQRLASERAALAKEIETARQQIQSEREALATLRGEVQPLQGRLDEQAKAAAAQADALRQQIAAQDKRLGEVDQRLTQANQAARSAALRVGATEQIVTALDEGRPYPQALAALRRLGGDEARLGALEPFAASGAPTGPQMAAEFDKVLPKVQAAAEPASTAGGVGGVFQRFAARAVTVRPAGEAGPAPEGTPASRVQDALTRGDFAGALTAWQSLPEPARAVSGDFADRLRQRIAAGEAARALASAALSTVDAPAR
jgi:hypothetical protein